MIYILKRFVVNCTDWMSVIKKPMPIEAHIVMLSDRCRLNNCIYSSFHFDVNWLYFQDVSSLRSIQSFLCIVSHYFWLHSLYENIHSKWSFVSEKVSTSRIFCMKSNKTNRKYWVNFLGMHSLHPYILLSVFEIWRFVWIHLWRWYMHTASNQEGESVSEREKEVIILKLASENKE